MKNVLVVGCSQGIGFETVKVALSKGNRVFAASRNLNPLIELKENNLYTLQCDISNADSIEKMVQQFESYEKKLDAIIVTAGLLIKKEFHLLTEEDFHHIYQTNVYGVFYLIRTIDQLILPGASVTTIGSMGGVSGALKFPGMLFYSSSKAALSCLTECLAVEYQNQNIHCNSLALGAVETDMKNQAFPEFKAPHKPEEIAPFIVDFALTHYKLFNGKTLPVSVSTP